MHVTCLDASALDGLLSYFFMGLPGLCSATPQLINRIRCCQSCHVASVSMSVKPRSEVHVQAAPAEQSKLSPLFGCVGTACPEGFNGIFLFFKFHLAAMSEDAA